MAISKSQARKIGSTIRRFHEGTCDQETYIGAIDGLKEFRAQFSEPLDRTLVVLQEIGRDFPSPIESTKRLKREVTIVDKIANRETGLDLSRMQDIGGCRVVVPTLDDLYEFADRVETQWDGRGVGRIHDYVKTPRDSGYRAIHIVIEESGLPIEIQLRSKSMHSWAELSESLSALARLNFKQDGDHIVQQYLKKLSDVLSAQDAGLDPEKGSLAKVRELAPEVIAFLNSVKQQEEDAP